MKQQTEVQVIDKRDNRVKAVIPSDDKMLQVLKETGNYKFKELKK